MSSEIKAGFDEGWSTDSAGTVPYFFDEWLITVRGDSDDFDFEDDDENWSTTDSEVDLQYTFDEWLVTVSGSSVLHDFESDNEGYTTNDSEVNLQYELQEPMDTS